MRGAALLAVAVLICSCEKSQSYYEDAPAERAQALKSCSAGQLRGRDCQTAAAAEATARHADAEQTFKNMSEGR